jgi:hypothetical protein
VVSTQSTTRYIEQFFFFFFFFVSMMTASSLSGTPREAPRSTKERRDGALNVRERCVEGRLLSEVRRQSQEVGD